MKLEDIKIDDAIRNRIPPLTAEQRDQLRDNILADGEITSPLIVWKQKKILLDGHHRLSIWDDHASDIKIPAIKLMSFEDQDAAEDWIDRNAIGQRSLSVNDRDEIIARVYDREVKTLTNPTGTNHKREVGGHSEPQPKTAEKVGKTLGVSEATVKRAVKKAAVVKKISAEVGEEEAEAAKSASSRVIAKAAKQTTGAAMVNTISGGTSFDVDEIEAATPVVDIEALAAPYQAAVKDINKHMRILKGLSEEERTGAHLALTHTRIRKHLKDAKAAISSQEPVQACGECHGNRCDKCQQTGFWTRTIVDGNR